MRSRPVDRGRGYSFSDIVKKNKNKKGLHSLYLYLSFSYKITFKKATKKQRYLDLNTVHLTAKCIPKNSERRIFTAVSRAISSRCSHCSKAEAMKSCRRLESAAETWWRISTDERCRISKCTSYKDIIATRRLFLETNEKPIDMKIRKYESISTIIE